MARDKLKAAICPVRAACDGADMVAGRAMCGLCRKRLGKAAREGGKASSNVDSGRVVGVTE